MIDQTKHHLVTLTAAVWSTAIQASMRPVGIANASGQQAMGVDLNAAVPIAVELASKLLQEIERKNENGINRIKT